MRFKKCTLNQLIRVAALLTCLYLVGCASPAERKQGMQEECNSYDRPRGIDNRVGC